MKNRAERLKSAYGELLKRRFVSTRKDVAEKMGASPTNVSSAFNGDPRVLTDRFLSRFNAAFDNIFSLDWLINGEGEMLRESAVQASTGDNSPNQSGTGNSLTVSCNGDVTRFLSEIAAQRKLAERALDLLEKRDAQVDELITLLKERKL